MAQDGQNWDAKADFDLYDRESRELTRLGAMYQDGELQKFVGRRVAVRVYGVPSKTEPKPGHRSYVNYRAVSIVALDGKAPVRATAA